MHVFTIRDIENLTGIKAHTLRIWEQRYQLMVPDKETGQHRTYNNEDLKQLLKISTLYHNGYKISKIAALTKDQVNKLALDTLVVKDPYELYVTQLVEAAIDFDELKFEQVMNTCILHYSFEKTIFRVVFAFLNKIGMLWMTGHVVPAMEHFSSELIRKKIMVALDGLKLQPANNMKVLLFAPEYERHELPLLMMQYILKKNNIRCVLFGHHVSLQMLDDYCQANEVTHLYAHIITYLHRHDPGEYVNALSMKFPAKQIILSGPVAQSLKRSFVNVRVLTNEEMGSWFAPH